ncbi:MAG: methyltransferase domain-containing protein [Verrucomicrobiae bacterium]|nr:methyltransferase domain-containing protein [Verrucomicrobiae bacterium]
MEPTFAQEAKAGDTAPQGARPAAAEFDSFAGNYDSELQKGLRLSGESKDYFAEGRMRHLRSRLLQRDFLPEQALDFGCGTGTATPFFFDLLGIRSLRGFDPSGSSLEVARESWKDYPASFSTTTEGWEDSCDLAFCNGVFHHIPVRDRAAALATIRRILKPGGLFAFWENNPWNPITRLAMRLVPFDADAILVWPHQAHRLLRESGFEVIRTDYVFFFPRFLSALRALEPRLSWLPLGGQYLVLCRRAE